MPVKQNMIYVALLLLLLSACSNNPPLNPAGSSTPNLHGHVLTPSGDAAAASVELLEAGNGELLYDTSTDVDGAYSFHNLPAAPYTLLATTPEGLTAIQRDIRIHEGGQPVIVDVTVQPAATIRGFVAADRAPAANVEVLIPGTPFTTKTAADGSYRLSQVPAGTHSVAFSKAGYSGAVQENVTARPGRTVRLPLVTLQPASPGDEPAPPVEPAPEEPAPEEPTPEEPSPEEPTPEEPTPEEPAPEEPTPEEPAPEEPTPEEPTPEEPAPEEPAPEEPAPEEPAPGSPSFSIELEFVGSGFTSAYRQAFQQAAARWSSVIRSDLPDMNVRKPAGACGRGEPAFEGVIDDLLIHVMLEAMPAGILGSAGPCGVRSDGMPYYGTIKLNSNEISRLSSGALTATILHEMGHILGIGTLWDRQGLLDYVGNCNSTARFSRQPTFTGSAANSEYALLRNAPAVSGVPVEGDAYGPGTRCGHWREAEFGHELMTGILTSLNGQVPLSRMTIASLRDLGYAVDMSQADPYSIPAPGMRTLSLTGERQLEEIILYPQPLPADVATPVN
jgi:hypothetical protein